jgi:hypothetical protein
MEQVVERGNMWRACERVLRNKGAAGADGMWVQGLKARLQTHWHAVKAALLAGSYRAREVRAVDIPKPSRGVRTLGVPTVVDRLIQQALLQILQPMFESGFSPSSYGFRPGRNAWQAMQATRDHVGGGRGWVVDIDLAQVLRPRQPRPADGEGGAGSNGHRSAPHRPAVPGGGPDALRVGAATHGGHAERRTADEARAD